MIIFVNAHYPDHSLPGLWQSLKPVRMSEVNHGNSLEATFEEKDEAKRMHVT